MKSDNTKIKLAWAIKESGIEHALNIATDATFLHGGIWHALADTNGKLKSFLATLPSPGTDADRHNYDLTPDSVVLDCGGYKGDFAAQIYGKYGCTVHVLEPVGRFYDGIVKRFGPHHPKIHVHKLGVGESSGPADFGIQNDSTGQFAGSEERETVQLMSVEEAFILCQLGEVDVIKMNCEGAEFPVLESLVASGLIRRVKNIQCQFHPVVPDCEQRYAALQEKLAETHYLTMYSGWQWQNWRLSHD